MGNDRSRMNLKRIATRLRSADGAEIAEAAMVLPLVFMLLLGIVWFGRAFNIYSTIQQAAQQGAITAAREPCATCGGSFPTSVDTIVKAVMHASSLNPSQIKPSSPSLLSCVNPAQTVTCATSSSTNVTVCQQVLLNSVSTPPAQCGAVVSFQYPFSFYLPFTSLNLQQVILSAQAQSRMEN
ncbi:MAG: TadE family protein [Terriglobales bacterium]